MFQKHHGYNRSLFKHMTEGQLRELTEGTIRAEVKETSRVQLLSFADFVHRQEEHAA